MSGLKVYVPVVPVMRECAFAYCHVAFLAHRKDKRYCNSTCRSNDCERRLHGRVLLGSGVVGGAAVRFYAQRREADAEQRYAERIRRLTV